MASLACGGSSLASADTSATDSVATIVLGQRDVAPVTMQPIAAGIAISGSLDPAVQVEIKSQMAGQVTRVLAERGTPVAQGQVLAGVDAGALRAQLASAEAALASAERDLSAVDTLFKRGAVSERDFVQARVARDAAAAKVAEERESLGKSTIRSPIAGVVSERVVEAGEAVQVATKLFTVVNSSTLELIGRVAPDAIGRVRTRMPVRLTLDAYPGRVFAGSVARIEPVAEAGTRQVAVYVHVPNPARELVGGLYASGTILTSGGGAAVATVPSSAVRETEGVNAVFAVDNDRIVRRVVTLGARDTQRGLVEIRSGVSVGALVLVDPTASLQNGARVRLLADTTGNLTRVRPVTGGNR